MARVLICEPHEEVRALLSRVVSRLGHEAVPASGDLDGDLGQGADVLLIEPADPHALALAKALRLRDERLPIVCASIYPEAPHTRQLRPVAYLVKPFALADLERVLAAAVTDVSVAA